MTSPICYGANFKVVGKTDSAKLSYSGAFIPIQGTIADLANHIRKGHPWMPALLDEGMRRNQQYSNYAEILAIDVDNSAKSNGTEYYEGKLTIEQATKHPFIIAHCALLIESASSKPDWHKFRMVFRLPRPLTDWKLIRICNAYLAILIGAADPACKDASRFFFGASGRVPIILNELATLPNSFIDDALTWHQKIEAEAKRWAEIAQQQWEKWKSQLSEDDVESLILTALDAINPDCEYNEWIAVGMALAGMGNEWFSVWDSWSAKGKSYKPGECQGKWKSFRGKQASPGTIFGIAKRYGFRFPKRQKQEQTDSRAPDSVVYQQFIQQELEKGRIEEAQKQEGVFHSLKKALAKASRKLEEPRGFAPRNPEKSNVFEYGVGERLEVWRNLVAKHSFIQDKSLMGLGKSHDAGLLNPFDLKAHQIIYVASNHRNPPTGSLQKEWVDLEARHGGLTIESTPAGGKRLKRAEKGEIPDIPPNCNRHRMVGVLRNKAVSGVDTARIVCGTCPLREACTHAEGPGYGFLHQRLSALNAPRLRAHPDSLPDPAEFDYSDTVLVWEEPSESLRSKRTIKVSLQDLNQTLLSLMEHPDLFNQTEKLLAALRAYLNGTTKTDNFGLSHLQIVEKLPDVSGIDATAIEAIIQPDWSFLNTTAIHGVDLAHLPVCVRKKFADTDREIADKVQQRVIKPWLHELLRVLQGQTPGSLHLHQEQLAISIPDERHRAVIQACKAVIFLDGTLDQKDLALMIGISEANLIAVEQKVEAATNLKITQICDLGRLGMSRGEFQQQRVKAIVQHFQQLDPTTKKIDFLKFSKDSNGSWWKDSRGSNDFTQCKTLILVGTPCRNLTELKTDFAILTGSHDFGEKFSQFCDRWIRADILQGIYRLRPHQRPDEQLHVVLLSDFDVGLPVDPIKASDITLEAAGKFERFTLIVTAALAQLRAAGQKTTQSAVAKITDYSQQYISKHWKLLLLLLENLDNKSSKNSVQPAEVAAEPIIEATAAVLETVTADLPASELPDSIEDVFFQSLPLEHWDVVLARLSGRAKFTLIESLLLLCPPDTLEELMAMAP